MQEELYRSRRAVSSTISRELFRNLLEFILAKTVRVLCPYLEECHWPLCIGVIYHPIGEKSLFGPRDPRRIRRGNIKVYAQGSASFLVCLGNGKRDCKR